MRVSETGALIHADELRFLQSGENVMVPVKIQKDTSCTPATYPGKLTKANRDIYTSKFGAMGFEVGNPPSEH